MASGGHIELNGPVARDVRIQADEIVIGPQARIGGDLHLRGERIQIAPGAVIQGRTTREIVKHPEHAAAAGLRILATTLFALGVLLVSGVIAAAAPRPAEDIDRRLRSRLWATAGTGALIVFLAPLVILTLLATVLGAPLGLVLGLAYLLAVPLAFAGVAYSIGQLIRGRLAPSRAAAPPGWMARLGWTMLAALLLMVVCMIPILGGLIWLFALASGMGALAALAVRDGAEPPPAAV
jgi:hypothetical protein